MKNVKNMIKKQQLLPVDHADLYCITLTPAGMIICVKQKHIHVSFQRSENFY